MGLRRIKKPKYCYGFVDRHGKARFYLRRPGFKSIPLPGIPYSPEFSAAYEAAMAGSAASPIGSSRTKPGSVNAVVVAYYSDLAFASLSDGTQKARRAILERFRSEHGDKRISLLQSHHLAKILGAKKPQAARSWRKTLRGLMKFAVARGYRQDDPTQGVTFQRVKSDGRHTWTEDEIEQFEAAYPIGTRARLAFGLLLFTAQRRSDVIRMGRQHIRDGILRVKQQKTGKELDIPIHSDLQAIIDGTPGDHLTFLVAAGGKPFTAAGFGNLFRDWCNDAKLPQRCSAHGLRKAACRRLAEAGCSEKQIAAISGHDSLSEVQRYTRAASQARLAKDAMSAIDQKQNKELQTSVPGLQKAKLSD
jgi:integrase